MFIDNTIRYNYVSTLRNDQLELDLFTVVAEAKSPTWTKQFLSELKINAKVFVDVCDMTDDEALIAKANELHSKINALR